MICINCGQKIEIGESYQSGGGRMTFHSVCPSGASGEAAQPPQAVSDFSDLFRANAKRSHQNESLISSVVPRDGAVGDGVRVLIACEFSGVVRDAFTAAGAFAVSCDLIPSEAPGWHCWGNVLPILNLGWDLMIAHPPCTHLAVSGARWFKDKQQEQAAALEFVKQLLEAPIPHICVENPVSIISSRIRRPDQIIQPWQFGHGETKATCLWLKNLPKLQPTQVVAGRVQRVFREPPSPERWKNRSRTYKGIADAMARQWLSAITDARPAVGEQAQSEFRRVTPKRAFARNK